MFLWFYLPVSASRVSRESCDFKAWTKSFNICLILDPYMLCKGPLATDGTLFTSQLFIYLPILFQIILVNIRLFCWPNNCFECISFYRFIFITFLSMLKSFNTQWIKENLFYCFFLSGNFVKLSKLFSAEVSLYFILIVFYLVNIFHKQCHYYNNFQIKIFSFLSNRCWSYRFLPPNFFSRGLPHLFS